MFLRAFENFFNDFLPFLLLAIVVAAWLIRKALRHDEIETFVKERGGRLVEKLYFTREVKPFHMDERPRRREAYYKIKYYDKWGKLHATQLKVNTFFNGVTVESDEIIN